MPVSGRELASLDFGNLIGGPLNAIVEAQAKAAITTANFIKEVAFDKNGNVINVTFSYSRKNDNGNDQSFSLSVPFLTMLPVPYITVTDAVVEFNAKITSVNESHMESNFSQEVNASVGGNYWFIRASVTSKTAYQKKSSTSEKEERTYDMHVRVEAKNQDMPSGTERILTILENSIGETKGPVTAVSYIKLLSLDKPNKKLTVDADGSDISKTLANKSFKALLKPTAGQAPASGKVTISAVDKDTNTITVDKDVDDSQVGQSVELIPSP